MKDDEHHVLTDKQQRLVQALSELKTYRDANEKITLRELSCRHDVPLATLCRASKRGFTASSVLETSSARGRARRITKDEEDVLKQSIIAFQENGTPLDRESVCDLVSVFVKTLCAERRKKLNFKDDKPGKAWFNSFLSRNSDLTLKKRASLENERYEAMTPNNLATHFVRLKSVMNKYSFNDPTRIFNLDESGFSMKGMAHGRTKCLVKSRTRANTRDNKFQGNIDHVTIMPVISASGQALTPLVVLPGVRPKYRTRGNGKFETPADYLPQPNYLKYRSIAGVDTDIFFSWACNFVEETVHLRRDGRYLLLIMDGYSAHISFKTLSILRDNNVVVVGLPAHTSHALQPLDLSVFGPMKAFFRQLLARRTITTETSTRNDIYTVCELFTKSYHQAITASNCISGFRKAGIWSTVTNGVDPDQIKQDQFTSRDLDCPEIESVTQTRSVPSAVACSNDQSNPLISYKKLYSLYLRQADRLCSDGTVEENGHITVSTTIGATLTSTNVLSAVRARDERRREEAQKRAETQRAREQRALEREQEQREVAIRRAEREKLKAQREEEAAKKQAEKEEHQREREREQLEVHRMRQRRLHRLRAADESREIRRKQAKDRTVAKSAD